MAVEYTGPQRETNYRINQVYIDGDITFYLKRDIKPLKHKIPIIIVIIIKKVALVQYNDNKRGSRSVCFVLQTKILVINYSTDSQADEGPPKRRLSVI